MEQFEYIGTIMSAILVFIAANFNIFLESKRDSLKYITAERKLWRDELRKLTEQLCSENVTELKKTLFAIKVRINTYGISQKEKGKDAHIWELIYGIEDELYMNDVEYSELKEIISLQTRQLSEYISALLKYDWERSKEEVKEEKRGKIVYWYLQMISIFLMINGLMRIDVENIFCSILKNVICLIMILSPIILEGVWWICKKCEMSIKKEKNSSDHNNYYNTIEQINSQYMRKLYNMTAELYKEKKKGKQ